MSKLCKIAMLLKVWLLAASLFATELPESVCRVLMYEDYTVKGMGTGTLVQKDETTGYVLTASHVAVAVDKVAILKWEGEARQGRVVYCEDPNTQGLAVIACPRPSVSHRPVLFRKPKPGDKVFYSGIGNPRQPPRIQWCKVGRRWNVLQLESAGIVSSAKCIYLHSVPRQGDSGAPVCDNAGNVVGVIEGFQDKRWDERTRRNLPLARKYWRGIATPVRGCEWLEKLCRDNEQSIVRE